MLLWPVDLKKKKFFFITDLRTFIRPSEFTDSLCIHKRINKRIIFDEVYFSYLYTGRPTLTRRRLMCSVRPRSSLISPPVIEVEQKAKSHKGFRRRKSWCYYRMRIENCTRIYFNVKTLARYCAVVIVQSIGRDVTRVRDVEVCERYWWWFVVRRRRDEK